MRPRRNGEAGIGKSRLLEETLHRAQEPWICFTGNCYEQDAAYPYSLWIDALRRSLLRGKNELFSGLPGAVLRQLSKLIPELESPEGQPTQRNPDPEEEKRRLFGAILQFIVHFAATRPVLVELEDLHWSDEASIDMLRFVVRHMTGYHVLLIATYRSDEIRPPLASFLADMDRQPQVVELRLAALSRPEVDRMVSGLLGSQLSIHLPALYPMYPLMEGNPFYIEEITQSLVEGGLLTGSGGGDEKNLENVEIPRSVQETVRKRLETVSAGAHDLVTLAEEIGCVNLVRKYDPDAPRGVAGRNSDNTFIQQILGWEPHIPFREGLAKTYAWIEQQYADRKAGKQTVRDLA